MLSNLYALDIETTGLDSRKDRILGIGVWSPTYSNYFIDILEFKKWADLFKSANYILHRGAFDISFLRNNGVDVRNNWAYDTRSMASVLTPRPESLGLEYLAEVYLGQASYKLDRTNMQSYNTDQIREYCLKDCELTYKLFQLLKERITGKSWQFIENWIMPATRFCADMEHDGVWIDKPGLTSYRDEMVKRRDVVLAKLNERAALAIQAFHEKQVKEVSQLYKEMYEKAKEKSKDKEKCLRRYALLESTAISKLEPFNWNSSDQLKWLLRDYLGLNIFNSRELKETTNEAMLASLSDQHEIPKILLEYRELEKLVETCIPALLEHADENSFVHTSYHIGGTRTGRLSSSSPNLQQIPKGRLRSYIQAVPRYPRNTLVTIDYAQIEVRIIAEVAKETELINAFKEGIDPYSIIAAKLFRINGDIRTIKTQFPKERNCAKTAGLSILYGTGALKLQEVIKKDLGLDIKLGECKNYIEDYRNSFPKIKKFKQDLEQKLANQKVYYNLLGRPFVIESNEDLYMKSLNTLVQGSASDLVVASALNVEKRLKELGVDYKCRMLIHDEQVWQLPENEAQLLVDEVIVPEMTTKMQRKLNMVVPLKVEYSINTAWEKP